MTGETSSKDQRVSLFGDGFNEPAREFYEHFDFEPSLMQELQLMLLMKDLRKALEV